MQKMQSMSAEYSGAPFGYCSAKHCAQALKSASCVQSTAVLLLDDEEDEELELVLTVVPPVLPPALPPVLPPEPPEPPLPPAEEPEPFEPHATREPAATTIIT